MYDFFLADVEVREQPIEHFDSSILETLLAPFSAVFDKPDSLPPVRPDDHAIKLTDDEKVPPWRPLGTLSQHELAALKEYITDLLNKGWIQHSKSPFGANILFAKKKDDCFNV